MGGYVTSYKGDFSFATIRGSGHMVPEYKPEAGFVLIKTFLEGGELPRLRQEGLEVDDHVQAGSGRNETRIEGRKNVDIMEADRGTEVYS